MDTIYALSSGTVPSGVAVIRISGPVTAAALEAICGRLPTPRIAALRDLRSPDKGDLIDRGLVLWFPAPASFTGENCGELHVHGGRAVINTAFAALAAAGLRMAEPGEFTKRGFLNGKLDLTEAEGIADLVAAETEMQRRQALQQAGGELSARAAGWRASLIELRAELEARLDFSEEGDVADALPASFQPSVTALMRDLREALASAGAGERMREGFRVAILGRPNAGKSSLLNALARRDVAIVTDEPGTTRDVLEVPLDLGGYPVLLFDTAGLRDSDSVAEREGVRRAARAAESADLVLWLTDPGAGDDVMPAICAPVWRIRTKADLHGTAVADGELALSSRTGAGLSELGAMLAVAATEALGTGGALVARERQRRAIADALACVEAAAVAEEEDVAADLLRSASDAIGRLSGRVGVEDVLDRLFQGFCIGK